MQVTFAFHPNGVADARRVSFQPIFQAESRSAEESVEEIRGESYSCSYNTKFATSLVATTEQTLIDNGVPAGLFGVAMYLTVVADDEEDDDEADGLTFVILWI
jgi:hypothetical protein